MSSLHHLAEIIAFNRFRREPVERELNSRGVQLTREQENFVNSMTYEGDVPKLNMLLDQIKYARETEMHAIVVSEHGGYEVHAKIAELDVLLRWRYDSDEQIENFVFPHPYTLEENLVITYKMRPDIIRDTEEFTAFLVDSDGQPTSSKIYFFVDNFYSEHRRGIGHVNIARDINVQQFFSEMLLALNRSNSGGNALSTYAEPTELWMTFDYATNGATKMLTIVADQDDIGTIRRARESLRYVGEEGNLPDLMLNVVGEQERVRTRSRR